MVAHTGFLVFARKMLPTIAPIIGETDDEESNPDLNENVES
jgi:hypothetical protein